MKLLKPLIMMGCLALFSTSCKKAFEKKVQDLVMDAITHGEWIVEQYFEDSTNLSSQFFDYRFKFNEDRSLISTVNSISTEGTWDPNLTNYTITADFPTGGDPLKKLNGLWTIRDSGWDYVKADMQTTNGTKLLILRKK